MQRSGPLAVLLFVVLACAAPAATYLVSNTNAAGAGSFDAAWTAASTNPGRDEIHFNIAGTGPHVIALASLPVVADQLSIKGETEPDYAGPPVVHLRGHNIPPPALLRFQSGCTVSAVRISGFLAGVQLQGGDGNRVRASEIVSNDFGIYINFDSTGNLIGGTTAADRNIISANTNGIWILTGGNQVLGNFIGTDASGSNAWPNAESGVRIDDAFGPVFSNVVAGGAGYPQVISGNAQAGVRMEGPLARGHRVQGCLIGTDVGGTRSVSNRWGVYLLDAVDNVVGGTNAAQRNVISGNGDAGVLIQSALAQSNRVAGNYIGLDAAGTNAVPNYYGVLILEGRNNTVGGATTNESNVISGNLWDGVQINGSFAGEASQNQIAGNLIGLDAAGVRPLGNGADGVALRNGAKTNFVGGMGLARRNFLCANTAGVGLYDSNTVGNVIQANAIGLAPSGAVMSNDVNGIIIYDSPGNQVGGIAAGQENVICGHSFAGLLITGSNAAGNAVEGNFIGLDAAGIPRPNQDGIRIGGGARSNRIGALGGSSRNIISGNRSAGVVIHDDSPGNVILRNHIGVSATGLGVVSNVYGVSIYGGGSGTIVGGTNTGSGNLISGNLYGVHLADSATNVTIAGNFIGTDVTGLAPLGNYRGVHVEGRGHTVGATDRGLTLVSGNDVGLEVGGSSNTILGCWVGLGADGLTAVSNNTGIMLYGAADGNRIGVSTLAGRNFVGGNAQVGIHLAGTGVSNVVAGNVVGLSTSLLAAVANGKGVLVSGGRAIIGGAGVNARNWISGSHGAGVEVAGSTGTVVQGNYIGVNGPGTAAVSNQTGVYVAFGAVQTLIGGSSAGAANLISGNSQVGVLVASDLSLSNVIAGNVIGLDAAGAAAIPNGSGVNVNAPHNRVGGGTASERNVISGNAGPGVELGSSTRHCTVAGNYIGVAANGSTALGNGIGVYLSYGATSNTVGGTGGAGNVISGNGVGVYLLDTNTMYNWIAGNRIGVSAAGSVGPSNTGSGVFINLARRNMLGGTDLNARNIISGNGGHGVEFYSFDTNAVPRENRVENNHIGVLADGVTPAPNLSAGVYFYNGVSNVIGGDSVFAQNRIACNRAGGVILRAGGLACGNAVLGNAIYSNQAPARLNIDLGDDGADANDALDGDTGPNDRQNSPTITNAFRAGNTVVMQGYLRSAPSKSYRCEFFASDSAVAQGQTFLGFGDVLTSANGTGTFTIALVGAVPTNFHMCATATDEQKNTSELSLSAVPVGPGADSDGDLMPDYWETLYGLNPAATNAPGSDFDMDGFSDLAEWIADTAANDNQQCPRMSAIGMAATNRSVSFASSAARFYRVQAGRAPGDALAWTNIASLYGAPVQTTYIDPALMTQRIYRVSVQLP